MWHKSAAKKFEATEGFPITRVLHVFAPGLEHQTVWLPRGNNWQQLPATVILHTASQTWISALPNAELNQTDSFLHLNQATQGSKEQTTRRRQNHNAVLFTRYFSMKYLKGFCAASTSEWKVRAAGNFFIIRKNVLTGFGHFKMQKNKFRELL